MTFKQYNCCSVIASQLKFAAPSNFPWQTELSSAGMKPCKAVHISNQIGFYGMKLVYINS